MFFDAHVQTTLWREHGIRTVRRTLAEVASLGSVGADGALRIAGDVAAVIYFRAGCVVCTLLRSSVARRLMAGLQHEPTRQVHAK